MTNDEIQKGKMMKLWILRNLDDIDYDDMEATVVRAKDETAARRLASGNAKNENGLVWLESGHSTCKELLPDGEQVTIISSVNWG